MLKLNNKFFALILLALSSFIIIGCADDDETTPTAPEGKSITTLASENSDLSILVEALKLAGLDGTLNSSGTYTVFAPTNAAFQALLDGNPAWNSLNDIPADLLRNVLLFHVLNAEVMAADLSNTYVNTLAVGPNDENVSLQVSTTGGVMFNGSSKPITTDIEASNGVIHTVDKVMLPPNIVTLALNNPNFSILVSALTDGRHQADFVAILNAAGPYTVFAPTNAAFEALLASNPSWNSLADIPIETLAAVLSYHVLASANVQSNQLTNNQEITMFSGGKLTVDLSNGAKLKTSSNQTVNISVVDVQGTNGVIHGIDSVLLP